MDPQAHGQVHFALSPQAGVELAQGLHDPQPGPHCALGVVFVGLRIAEVDKEPITEVLGNMPLIASDHLGAGLLIGAHYLAQVFGVKLAREGGGVHQITKQHRQLAAFGIGYRRCGGGGGRVKAGGVWGGAVGGGGGGGGGAVSRVVPAARTQTKTSPSSSTASRCPLMSSIV